MEMAPLPHPSPLAPRSPPAPKSPLPLRRAGLGCGASEGDVVVVSRVDYSPLPRSAGRDRYSGNAGEGRNLLTTIREPQLYATEGFMRMWVISSTVESNIINTCCCFFCFCKNAHKKFSARTPLSDSTMRCWIFMHPQIPIHGMNEMLQDCRHLHAHEKISCDMRCNVAMNE